MAGTDTIIVYRGEDVDLDFTMNPVVDISGWTIVFTVELPTPITVACSITDGPSGTFQATIADTNLDALRAGVYQYDAWRTDSGTERVLAEGDFEVRDVARITL